MAAVGEVRAMVVVTHRRGVPTAARPGSSESAPSMAAVEEARALLVAIGRRRVQGQHEPSEAVAGNEFGL